MTADDRRNEQSPDTVPASVDPYASLTGWLVEGVAGFAALFHDRGSVKSGNKVVVTVSRRAAA